MFQETDIVMFKLILMSTIAIGLPVAASACDLPAERPAFTKVQERQNFDTAAFATVVAQALGDRYMGYAVTLRGKNGNVIAQVNHGYARSPCENGGEQRFNGRTQAAIGSVSKVLTAATVIHRAETLQGVSLEDRFQDYLPRRWQSELDASLQPVTIRNLLQHRAGFAKSGKTLWDHKYTLRERYQLGAETYIVRAQNIATQSNACVPEPVTKRCYANTSFALWNVSAASLVPAKWAQIEDAYSPGEITYESYLQVHAYNRYRDIVAKTLFEPVGVIGGCNVFADPERGAYYYDGPMDETGIDRTEAGRPCAIGGWFLSTRALSKVVHRIVSTREVINDNHELMFSAGDDRLVFASRPRTNDGRAISHNGSRWGGQATAEVVVFPNGYVAAAIANSRKGNTGAGLRDAIIDGYNAARGPS
ncbi:serine hydrolase [Stappia sp. BW2]|nr:serine hydrolase [Stappia sp. BW2]